MADNNIFCFGYGYTCGYLGEILQDEGAWNISGTTRDSDRKKFLKEHGIKAHIFDYDVPLPDALYIMRDVTHLLISTPPSGDGDPVFNLHAEDIAQLPNLKWVGYLSTTGPYGDRGGDWVDENSTVRPTTKRGSRRLKAEEQWLSLMKAGDFPLHIFRLSGIYGPERSALDSVVSGIARRINKPGHVFNRIHVEDLVRIIRASMAAPSPGAIYNVCDDMPAPSHEVIDYACQLLNVESPELLPFDSTDLAPITLSFYADNKRIRNDKIKNDLGVCLKYPTYKEGLKACHTYQFDGRKPFKILADD